MKALRKFYWAFPAHLKSGKIVYCDHIKFHPKMVRVKVVLAPIKRRARK